MARSDLFDLGGLRLSGAEGRQLELEIAQDELELELAGERYTIGPPLVLARLDVSRLLGGGYALRLRFDATVSGPCMRCLDSALLALAIDSREVDVPGGGEELDSPYVEGDVVDVRRWAHDAVALATPSQVVCTPDCLGLCPICAVALARTGPEHHHESQPDPRWEKLRGLRFD
jgi:uncharacterized protein